MIPGEVTDPFPISFCLENRRELAEARCIAGVPVLAVSIIIKPLEKTKVTETVRSTNHGGSPDQPLPDTAR
jgi:hypothetical protein